MQTHETVGHTTTGNFNLNNINNTNHNSERGLHIEQSIQQTQQGHGQRQGRDEEMGGKIGDSMIVESLNRQHSAMQKSQSNVSYDSSQTATNNNNHYMQYTHSNESNTDTNTNTNTNNNSNTNINAEIVMTSGQQQQQIVKRIEGVCHFY